MKQILLMMAAVVLVGCASAPDSPEAKAADRAIIDAAIGSSSGSATVRASTKSLWLSGKGLNSVESLYLYTELTNLQLDNNKLTSVKGLENLTKLRRLSLYSNKLKSINGLEKLTELRFLHLSNNPKLDDLTPLEKLTNLEELYIWHNPKIKKAQIDLLRLKLPNCKIGHESSP